MDPQTLPPLDPNLNIETPLKDIQRLPAQKIESPETLKEKRKGIANIRLSTITGVLIILVVTFLFIFIPWPECKWFQDRATYPKTKLKNCPKSISIWQLIEFSMKEKP